jgi:hypothetical protein
MDLSTFGIEKVQLLKTEPLAEEIDAYRDVKSRVCRQCRKILSTYCHLSAVCYGEDNFQTGSATKTFSNKKIQ